MYVMLSISVVTFIYSLSYWPVLDFIVKCDYVTCGNSEEGFGLIVSCVVSCKVRTLRSANNQTMRTVVAYGNLAAKVICMWLLLTVVLKLAHNILACLF
jgi:hypothetical protein